MEKVKVIFGSTTGNTANAARQIAAAFGVKPVNIANAGPADFDAGLLILGSSTWGVGELQEYPVYLAVCCKYGCVGGIRHRLAAGEAAAAGQKEPAASAARAFE